mgnify:FL=1
MAHPSASWRRTRRWVSVTFALQGGLLALILTSLPGLKDRTGIDDTAVSAVVLTVLVFAATGSLVAGSVAPRRGSAWVLPPAFALQIAGLLALWFHLPYWALFPAFAVFGFGLGLGDAGNGMQGLTVQRAYGRSIINTFFAFQTAAAIVAALLVAAIGALDVRFEVAFIAGAVLGLVCLPKLRRGLARDPELDVTPAEKQRLPWRTLTLLGLAVAVVYIGDGVVSTWSSIYLQDTLLATGALVPMGYAAYQATVLLARLAGDYVVMRTGRAALITGAVVMASGGLALASFSPDPLLAILGFALTGLGLGVIVPLTFSAAGETAPEQMDEIVARLNLFNYAGIVVGSAATGVIADATSMRIAILVPAVLVLGIGLVTRIYRERRVRAEH